MKSTQKDNLKAYCNHNTLEIVRQIGFGIHGTIFRANNKDGLPTIVKVFDDELGYEREIAVYLRLQEKNIAMVGECVVPELVDFSDDLFIIEMTEVERPFALDFASAYLDELPAWFPPFSQEWWAEKEDQFGSEDFAKVRDVLTELELLGIFQTDVSPSNIAVREKTQSDEE